MVSEPLPIKFCGLTREEDAFLASELNALALGFIFYDKSPRYVKPEKLSEWIGNLPEGPLKIGVFVNEPVDTVRSIYHSLGLDLVQLHGDEPLEYYKELGLPCLQVRRVRSQADLLDLFDLDCVKAYLFDTYKKGSYGGTGESFSWGLLDGHKFSRPVFLSGGLNHKNLVSAMQSKASAFDLSSGIEKSPGIKNHDQMREIAVQVGQLSNNQALREALTKKSMD